jgi:RNA polymerase sigma-70 factor (ECF subfamily)
MRHDQARLLVHVAQGRLIRPVEGVLSAVSSEPAPKARPRSAIMNREALAFRAVYEQYFNFVWTNLRKLGVREADVADVVHKAFVLVHAKLPDFEYRSSLRTWLYAICAKLASDYRRSARIRREIVMGPVEMEELAAVADPVLQRVDTQQRLRIAEAILNRLPESQRTAFVLFELEDLSGAEIAQMLGVSVGTVRSRLRLARQTFAREVARIFAREQRAGKSLAPVTRQLENDPAIDPKERRAAKPPGKVS